MDDLIQLGAVLLVMTVIFIVGLVQIFKKDTPKPTSMRSVNIRRLGLREKEASLLYCEKDIMMATELTVNVHQELTHDEIKDTFERIADDTAILRCSIVTQREGRKYFVPMEEEQYDIRLVNDKNWTEEVVKVLRRRYDENVGPLWSVIYSYNKTTKDSEAKGHEYSFAFAYHPALLDHFSSRYILRQTVNALSHGNGLKDDINTEDGLLPSLDSLLKPRYYTERLGSLGFIMRCYLHSLLPTSSLRSRMKNKMKNTFINVNNVDRFNYKEVDKKTCIHRFRVDLGVDHSAIKEKAKKLELEVGAILLASFTVGLGSLKEDTLGSVTVTCGHIANARDLPDLSLEETSLGSYQYECPLTTVISKTKEVITNKTTMVSLVKHCQRQLRMGRTRAGCLSFLWEHRFLSTLIRPRINVDKILSLSKDRTPTDVIFDFCDVSDDVDISWISTSRGLGRQGPVVYVSAALLDGAVVFTVTYSSAVICESDVIKACDVTKDTLLKILS